MTAKMGRPSLFMTMATHILDHLLHPPTHHKHTPTPTPTKHTPTPTMVNYNAFLIVVSDAGIPWLLETLEKSGTYFGSFNPGNSLDFCVIALNPLEICERHKK